MTRDMIEVVPLRPFCGSYPCSLSEADVIDDELVEADGVVVKRKVARKKFVGLVAVQRYMTPAEEEMHRLGKLPTNIEVLEGGSVLVHPDERTLKLPRDVALRLIERRLADPVEGEKRQEKAFTVTPKI